MISQELKKAEEEYYSHAGRFYAQGRNNNGSENIGRYCTLHRMRLQRLLLSHFHDAIQRDESLKKVDLKHMLTPAEHSHLNVLRIMAWSDMRDIHRSFLPDFSPAEDMFSFGDGDKAYSFKIRYRQNEYSPTDAITTARIVGDKALVCLTHMSGSVGMSPVNAIESVAKEILGKYFFEFSPEDVQFFIHVPPECSGSQGELFWGVEMDCVPEQGYKNPRWKHYRAKPAILDDIVFEHFPKPQDIEEDAFNWVNGCDEGFHDESMQSTHAAQSVRDFNRKHQMG